ncbi:hypothetical protein [Pseudokineococcus sp. 1T1Z-3]|uniref:hypothetical protein n=1 Tax=Pseudokineococcus sp. 1T1Z-3 TaxID=3132745 RepID=UPI003096713E
MAGGGWSAAAQRRHDLLARSAATDHTGHREQGPEQEDPPATTRARRHCWVVLDEDTDPMPGVVAAWRRTDAGWLARVAYLVDEASGTTATAWLPASMLRPHESRPPPEPGGV